MRTAIAILFASVLVSFGAGPYYVSTNGDNGNAGTGWAEAWRTLTYAEANIASGDTVYIGPGDFEEYVQVAGILGTKWISESNAITRAFRLDTASNLLSGITLSKACDAGYRLWGSFVYLGDAAHYTTITNCNIVNQPWVRATNWSFNPAGANTNSIVGTSMDLLATGFAPGCRIFINGVSYSNTTRGSEYRFSNQQRNGFATNVTATTMVFSNDVLVVETNPSAYALISAGANQDWYGIRFIGSGGGGPSNCLVSSCLFSNMLGQPITMNGHDNVVTNCEMTAIYGNSFLNYSGYNQYIVSNYIHDCPLPAYYSSTEVVDHTGGTFYDYYVRTILGGTLQTVNSNIHFIGNWMEDIENAGINVEHTVTTEPHSMFIIGNVFVGIGGETDGGMDNTHIQSNTFYRCSYQEGHISPITVGGTGTHTNDGLYLTHNLMVSCGEHESHTNEGYPSITLTENIDSRSNYVCGPEVSKWNAMPDYDATNGVNGGDPMFVNEFNPRGPDGLPFTADDGLRLHPESPAKGIGALGVAIATSTSPFAYFRSVGVASNYLDYRGTNFNQPWHGDLFAFTRTTWDRTWDYGDAIANLPETVTFDATNSISGTWSTNDWVGIKDFLWDFGDGSRAIWTRWPCVKHTFLTTGQVAVTLTVTNSATNTATHTRNYRILPGTNFAGDVFYVATNGNDAAAGTYAAPFSTITNGMMQLSAGDYLCVLPGNYDVWVDPTPGSTGGGAADGTEANPITIVGLNARVEGISHEKAWWTWEGMELTGDITMTASNRSSYFEAVAGTGATGLKLRNNYIHDGAEDVSGILASSSGGVGGTNAELHNNLFADLDGGLYGIIYFAGWTNILLEGNIDIRMGGQADVLKVYGWDVTWRGQYSYLFGFTNNNHSDWMSIGPDSEQPTGDVLIEQCWAESRLGTETAIANNGKFTNSASYSNLVIRNCVFINFLNGMNPAVLDGLKVYNNLFYRAPWSNSSTIIHGISRSSYGADFRNNMFVENYNMGTSTENGWYYNGWLVGGDWDTNVIFTACDYNYVAGTNWAAKLDTPGDRWDRWGGTSQENNGVNGGDPMWTDGGNYDFRLATNSPLLGAGADLTATGFTTDFFGRPRPAAWSIGPFESVDFADGGGEPEPPASTNAPTKVRLRGSKVVLRGKVILR